MKKILLTIFLLAITSCSGMHSEMDQITEEDRKELNELLEELSK